MSNCTILHGSLWKTSKIGLRKQIYSDKKRLFHTNRKDKSLILGLSFSFFARLPPVRSADRFFLRLGAAAGPSRLAGFRAVPSAGTGVAAALDVSRAAALDRLAAGHRARSGAQNVATRTGATISKAL